MLASPGFKAPIYADSMRFAPLMASANWIYSLTRAPSPGQREISSYSMSVYTFSQRDNDAMIDPGLLNFDSNEFIFYLFQRNNFFSLEVWLPVSQPFIIIRLIQQHNFSNYFIGR